MEYRIKQGDQVRSLTQEELKVVETTNKKIDAINHGFNGLEAYDTRTRYLTDLVEKNVDARECVMYHVIIGSNFVGSENVQTREFTRFDFEGEQSLAKFVSKQFSEQLKAGIR